jgi:hypothetical protein
LLQTAMRAACIEVIEIDQTSANNSWITNDSASQNPNAWDTTTPFVHNASGDSMANPAVIGLPSRDVNINDNSFWCIQGVGAYEEWINSDWDWNTSAVIGDEPTRGVAKSEIGIFLIYQEAIRDFSKSGLMSFNYDPETGGISYPITDYTKSSEYYITLPCKRSVEEMQKLVTFHEVLHMFGFHDFGATSYDPNVDGEIMAKYWLFTETVSSSVM